MSVEELQRASLELLLYTKLYSEVMKYDLVIEDSKELVTSISDEVMSSDKLHSLTEFGEMGLLLLEHKLSSRFPEVYSIESDDESINYDNWGSLMQMTALDKFVAGNQMEYFN